MEYIRENIKLLKEISFEKECTNKQDEFLIKNAFIAEFLEKKHQINDQTLLQNEHLISKPEMREAF